MADSKISALTDGGNLQGTDQVAINRGGTSYRAVALQDGWIDDTAETWTYASGSGGGTATFTITGDFTAKYTVGTRIKLTQTTVKYFVVTAVTVTTGTTTVTITAGTDYTLANAAISANYHSYAANPQGYPTWFNYTTNATGFSSKTSDTAKFMMVGRSCTVIFNISGTSNAATFTCDAPVASPTQRTWPGIVLDSASSTGAVGRVVLVASTVSAGFGFTLLKTASGTNPVIITSSTGGFTTSGTKGVIGSTITYDV